MKDKLLYFIFAALMFLMLPSFDLSAKDDVPVEAIEVARTTIINFMNNEEARSDFESAGFLLPGDNVDNVKIGDGVRVYSINRVRLGEIENDDLSSALIFKGWSFLVLIDGNLRMLITVERRDDEWLFFELGKDYEPLVNSRQLWKETDGFSLSYVRVFGVTDFIMVEKEGEETLFYAFRENAHIMLGMYDASTTDLLLLEPADVVKKLQVQ